MKAMIFAAGLGTRLKPLTDTMPKALVPVGGKSLLQHTIEKLKAAGFDEIIINLHHFAGQIIDFVEENHHFGVRIEFSDECEKLLDTGGGIKKASWFFDDGKPFLVHNVDILSNINLGELYEANSKNNFAGLDTQRNRMSPMQKTSPIATLVCSQRETTRYLLFDDNHHLKGWINEKTGEVKSPFPHVNPLHPKYNDNQPHENPNLQHPKDFHPSQYNKLAFAGIQILQPSIFQYMTAFPDRFSIIDFYLSVCDKEEISCYIPKNLKLIDVGKPDSLNEAFIFLT